MRSPAIALSRSCVSSAHPGQVLAVVQYEQEPAVVQEREQGGARVAPAAVVDAQRVGHRVRHQRRVLYRRQLDQPDPVGERPPEPVGDPDRQARLADAGDTGQGRQAGGRQQAGDLDDLAAPIDEAGRVDGQVAHVS
jgi:hypothetical protein